MRDIDCLRPLCRCAVETQRLIGGPYAAQKFLNEIMFEAELKCANAPKPLSTPVPDSHIIENLGCDDIESFNSPFPQMQQVVESKFVGEESFKHKMFLQLYDFPFQCPLKTDDSIDRILMDLLRDTEAWQSRDVSSDQLTKYDPVKRLRGAAGPPKLYVKM